MGFRAKILLEHEGIREAVTPGILDFLDTGTASVSIDANGKISIDALGVEAYFASLEAEFTTAGPNPGVWQNSGLTLSDLTPGQYIVLWGATAAGTVYGL